MVRVVSVSHVEIVVVWFVRYVSDTSAGIVGSVVGLPLTAIQNASNWIRSIAKVDKSHSTWSVTDHRSKVSLYIFCHKFSPVPDYYLMPRADRPERFGASNHHIHLHLLSK